MNILNDVEKAMDVLVKEVRATLVKFLTEEGKPEGGSCTLNFPCIAETEFMKTPMRSRKQDAHCDARYDIVTAFISLNEGKTMSTYVAKNIDSPAGTRLNMLEYEQFEIPCSHTDPHIFFNHGTWPHYGPGNKSRKNDRFILFLSFAMDEVSSRHTTSETVLRML